MLFEIIFALFIIVQFGVLTVPVIVIVHADQLFISPNSTVKLYQVSIHVDICIQVN
jgi:hypothetical protein